MKAIYFFENDELIYFIDDRNRVGIDIYLPETNRKESIFIFKDFEDSEIVLESDKIIVFEVLNPEDPKEQDDKISTIRYELNFSSIDGNTEYSYGKYYTFNNLRYNIHQNKIDNFIYNFDILDEQLNPSKLRKNKLGRI